MAISYLRDSNDPPFMMYMSAEWAASITVVGERAVRMRDIDRSGEKGEETAGGEGKKKK